MMFQTALRASARASFVSCAALILLVSACGGEAPQVSAVPELAPPAGPTSELACSGDDPASFCDDCNPCTTDANCTPCSALPAGERDIYHCTADEDLPAICAGRTGCVHVAITTPMGQRDDCFPVVEAAEPHAGTCVSGSCVENY